MAKSTKAWLVLVLFVYAVLNGCDGAGRKLREKDDGVNQQKTFVFPVPFPLTINEWKKFCLLHPLYCSLTTGRVGHG